MYREEELNDQVMIALSMSLDGFIAGPHDGVNNALGDDGDHLFGWYFDGDTPIQFYKQASDRGIRVPPFKLSRSSAQVFEVLVESVGAECYSNSHPWARPSAGCVSR
jgi:hypothetical protein